MKVEKKKKKKILIIALLFISIVIATVVGIYFYLQYQTYHYMEVVNTYRNSSTDNANYRHCLGGVLRYSREGIAFLSETGEEKWNQPCQMSNPDVEVQGKSVAVGDIGGTSIFVFRESGLKGEIKTSRPIEKFSVSSQGIVCAILKDDEVPRVMCYDAVGTVLVEHQVSINASGYPVDVAISRNGKTLLVSYLQTKGNAVGTQICYYYFGEGETGKNDYTVLQQEYADTIIPTTAFMEDSISLLVSDHGLMFYKGLKSPKELKYIDIEDEIQSVAYNSKMVAVITRDTHTSEYKLKAYDTKGTILISATLDKSYARLKVVEDQVIMYDEQTCNIYVDNGVHKFDGNIEEEIVEIFPISGLNKYIVINANHFQEVRLVK